MHVLLCIYLVESDLSYSTHNPRNIMWALSSRGMASLVAPQGVSRDGAWASLPRGMWDLDQGLNPRPLCGDSRVTQTVENPPAVWETWVPSLGWEDSPGGGRGNPLQYSWASLVAQMVKNPPAVQETWVQSLGWEDSFPGEGNGYPLQYSCLENSMDRGAWWATVHGVSMSQTQLSDFTFTFHFHALEKEMATHSSTLAWRIPWTEEPGGLQSMGSQRVRHD